MYRPGVILVVVLGLACSIGLLSAPLVSAAEKAERNRAAAELVAEALRYELAGANSDRRESLDAALDLAEDHQAAWWQSGFARLYDQWLRYDEVAAFAAKDQRLTAYRRARSEYPETVEGQLALAEWCGKRKLLDQQRAHLTKVLEIDPDHQAARRQLGHRRVDGVWHSREEIEQASARANEATVAVQQWAPRLIEIRSDLEHRNRQRRQQASESLRRIDDPGAVLAVESVFCAHSEEYALLGVETLDQIAAPGASLALARQAVFSPSANVRQAAVEKLQGRDKHSYVPALLAVMQTPIQSRAELYATPTGRLTYRHALYREGQEEGRLAVFDTKYVPFVFHDRRVAPLPEATEIGGRTAQIPPWAGRASEGAESEGSSSARGFERVHPAVQLAIAQQDAAERAQAVQTVVARQNAMIQQFNQRVCDVLAKATDAVVAATPNDWWQWWYSYNDVYVSGCKPVRTTYQTASTDLPVPERAARHFEYTLARASLAQFSCLAAGTPVWTETGPVAVDQIRLGDRVLSQHVETGELAYKPVLKTTVRPPTDLVRFRADDETITCTGGHPFWVCGDGWVKAGRLVPGSRFHGVTGAVGIDAIDPADKQKAYNLVVADFHTYFVGNTRVLSHDNTVRQPTTVAVPGLARP
ncbi:MAG: hypothetical protein JXB62_03360 [Pirellulales bacterium]|nr:hypothetical protein [Pirellulales bacterium]